MSARSDTTPKRSQDVSRWDHETDVLVVGFGATGACTAIEAVTSGADTLVLESRWRGGGSSADSTAQIYMGGGTPLQKACGVEDTPEEMYKYLMASCGPGVDEEKIRCFCDRSVEHYHWLTEQGLAFDSGFVPYEVSTMPHPGQSLTFTGSERAYPYCEIARPAPRGHTLQKDGFGSGELMMQLLMKAAEDAGAKVMNEATAQTLVVEESGEVIGAVAQIGGQEKFIRARRGVVLTTGGFVRNQEMLRWYAPHVMGGGREVSAEGCDDGSGIRIGIGAGAAAVRMDAVCVVLGFAYGNRNHIRGILVNAQGQRYINEDVYQSSHGEIALKRQSGNVYLVIDDSIYAPPTHEVDLEGVTYPVAAVGETHAELESELGMPEGSLSHTLAVYNEHAARGEDPYFRKESVWLQALDKPPYAALDLRFGHSPYSIFTLGGLRTQTTGEVVDADGNVVPGLYAAGRTASGIPAQGYNSGLSLGDCTFTGRLAGASAGARKA